jgi:HAD superfamily hydrolase (TIGR01509 family)
MERIVLDSSLELIRPNVEFCRTIGDQGALRLIAVSNVSSAVVAALRRKFDLFSIFDATVFSSAVGYLKPAAAFYRAALSAAREPAGGCLFIDDRYENVEAAKKAGMVGVLAQTDAPNLSDLVRPFLTPGESRSVDETRR